MMAFAGISDNPKYADAMKAMGERNQWPAMDVLASLSRVMSQIVSKEHKQSAGKLRVEAPMNDAPYDAEKDRPVVPAFAAQGA